MRGTKRKIKHIPVKQEIKASIHNRFDIEVIDAVTGKIKQKAYAENVICNSLWTRLFIPANYFTYIHYGTGSGTPSASDTSLFTFLDYADLDYTNGTFTLHPTEGYCSLTRSIQLSETTAVGSTLTEVGIGYSYSSSSLVTHAMLKDMNGNNISITKTSTDIINIYATVFVHWPVSGFDSGNISVVPFGSLRYNSVQNGYGFLVYLAGLYDVSGHSDQVACAPTTFQAGEGIGRTAIASRPAGVLTPSYNSSLKTITLTMTRLGVNDYNIGGIKYFILHCLNTSGVLSQPAIILKVGGSWYPGSTIVGEAIGTGDGSTKNFATDFPDPSSATVYIDGVAVTSGLTIISAPIYYSDMGRYFEALNSVSTPLQHIFDPTKSIPSASIRYGSGGGLFYNPYYALGITSFYTSYAQVEVSNDLSTWVTLCASSALGTISVPTNYQNYKYWRVTASTGYTTTFTASSYSGNNIVFDTAPTNGSVITADYTTPTIAKNSNYVFDLSIVISLGEYTA